MSEPVHPKSNPSVASERAWRWAAVCLTPFAAAFAVRISLDSGVTLDEDGHRIYGEAIAAWFTSGFTDQAAASELAQRVYGGLFDLVGHLIGALNILPVFEILHVLTALTALSGVVATWLVADRIAGPRAGLLAAAYLALTPAWVGHGMFNSKDIPFAAGAAFALYATVRIAVAARALSWVDAVVAGICTGVALGVRPGAMFILAYPAAAALGWLSIEGVHRWRRGEAPTTLRELASITIKLATALVIAWGVMISAWPWAQLDPIDRPLEAAAVARQYEWRHKVLFDGERIGSYELPWTYLPTWFGITLPDLYLLAGVCALAAVLRLALRRRARPIIDERKALAVALCVGSIAAPLLAVIVLRPIIYDAQRHFLFLLPPLAALAGLATDHALRLSTARGWRALVAAGFLGLAAMVVADMRALHPYQYVYFSRWFGGLPAAAGRFETDYWGAANREGLAWVAQHVEPDEDGSIPVKTCSGGWQIEYYDKLWGERTVRLQRAGRARDRIIVVATTRGSCHKQPGKVLHRIERQGVPLVYVLEREQS